MRSWRVTILRGLDGFILLWVFLMQINFSLCKWLCGVEASSCPCPTPRAFAVLWVRSWARPCPGCGRSRVQPQQRSCPSFTGLNSHHGVSLAPWGLHAGPGLWGFYQSFYLVSSCSCSASIPYSGILHHILLSLKPWLLSGAVGAFPCALCPAPLSWAAFCSRA